MQVGLSTWGIVSAIKGKNNNIEPPVVQRIDISEFAKKELIVDTTLSKEELSTICTTASISSLSFEDEEVKQYLLTYSTDEEARTAYEALINDNRIELVSINKNRVINDKILPEIIYIPDAEGNLYSNWGPIVMGLDETANAVDSKKGEKPEIVVAVIDSGFNAEHSLIKAHPELANRILPGFDATKNTDEISRDVTDNDGHGSNVGGIILESTPSNVKIMPIKALEYDEVRKQTLGDDAWIVKAINYAVNQGADVINMSLGGEGVSLAQQSSITKGYNAGATIIAASGNGDEDGKALNLDIPGVDFSPAECENVIAVGALYNKLMQVATFDDIEAKYEEYIKATVSDLEITEFSNYGSAVDFTAPGMYIIGLTKDNNSLSAASGTSQAAPHISAAAATIKCFNEAYTSDQIEEILTFYSYDLGETGKDVKYGNGAVTFNDFRECDCGSDGCDGIYCFGCDNENCTFHFGEAVTLESIAVSTPPKKISYQVGQKFNSEGMVITATYSDKKSRPVTGYTYEPSGELAETDTKITITYKEGQVTKTVEYAIKVGEENEAVLTSIEITTPPTKKDYKVGETFDKTGMVVTAHYDDDSSKFVTTYQCSPSEALTKNDTKITVSYTEGEITKTAEQNITVAEDAEEKKLEKIEVTTPPTKTNYKVGDLFDKTGMVVTAYYSDGTNKPVTNYTVFPPTALTEGTTYVTIEYTENGESKTTSQNITVAKEEEDPPTTPKVLSKIEKTTSPTKVSYQEGEKFNTTGMVITAIYSDGTKQIVNNYTYSPTGALKATDTQIVVNYSEGGVTKTLNIPIQVKAANQGGNPGNFPTDPGKTNMFVVDNGNSGGVVPGGEGTGKQDGTTAKGEIAYTGAEETIIPIVISVLAVVAIISFVSYKKYKDI